ncbi:hypothetical protein KYB31_02225 [Clostridium felsineum]|uniref:hypothetical protein n=1 Tax=Clostridium felsineum TaxID=36839 RepID=UPI00214D9CEA|nr:hypothetical protein [Clostridium felsineum]MCR3757812.1 hypothetical protein [Clostridium felsineum]
MMDKKFIDKLNNKKLLSLDIFDTVIFRVAKNPQKIFEIVGQKLFESGNLDFELSAEEFKIMRIEAEKRARIKKRKSNTDEVFLEEIYEEFSDSIIKNKKEAIKQEIDIEAEYCYLNPEIVELIDYAYDRKIKIVLTSDMYLKEEDIRYILYKNGLNLKRIERIFVSSEYGVSKRDEGLFGHVFSNYKQIKREEMLHIGDNEVSDVMVPSKLGMDSMFYDVVHDNGNNIFEYEKILYNSPLEDLNSLRKLVCHDFKNDCELEVGGLVLGPFLTLYIDWVVNKLQKYNIKAIYPLMREGTILALLLKNEIDKRKLQIKVKPIYVSRKSTYIASIVEYNNEELEKVFLKNWKIKDLANNFNLNDILEVFGEFSEVHLKDTSEVKLKDETLYDVLKKFLLSERIKAKINSYIKEKRNILNRYLKQEIVDFENVATIDFGFVGTIQSSIENSLRSENINFKFYHFLAIAGGAVKDKLFKGINIMGFLGSFKENADLMKSIERSPCVLEQLLLDSVGTTLDHKVVNGRVEPVLKDTSFSVRQQEKKWWKGVLKFQEKWMEFRDKKPQMCKEMLKRKKEILQIFTRLVAMPTSREVEFIGSLEFEDKFGTDVESKILTDKDFKMVKKYGEEYVDKHGFMGFYKFNILWYEGAITKLNPNFYVKKYLETKGNDTYFNAAIKIVEKVQDYGLDEIVVYGAGEVGESVIKACQFYDVKILNIVDRNQDLWGKKKQGIKVISLSETLEAGCKNYIIASFSFIDEIKKTIMDKAKSMGKNNIEIFYVE